MSSKAKVELFKEREGYSVYIQKSPDDRGEFRYFRLKRDAPGTSTIGIFEDNNRALCGVILRADQSPETLRTDEYTPAFNFAAESARDLKIDFIDYTKNPAETVSVIHDDCD